jgi:glyoxalase/bleomycin resistance protein/dioxygenase superfamily protein
MATKRKSPIRGMHALFYSSQPEALRTFLRDTLGFDGTDVGDGWLILDMPEADLGVHPVGPGEPPSGATHLSFYCDDIHASMRELAARGVEFTQEPQDQGWGLVARMRVPGGFDVQIYQPKYAKK